MLRLRSFLRPLVVAAAVIVAVATGVLVWSLPDAMDLARRQDRVLSLESSVADWNGRAADARSVTDGVQAEAVELAAERASAAEHLRELKKEASRLQRRMGTLERRVEALGG